MCPSEFAKNCASVRPECRVFAQRQLAKKTVANIDQKEMGQRVMNGRYTKVKCAETNLVAKKLRVPLQHQQHLRNN